VKPELCITGHIHEARGTDMIGETLVINPGDLASGGYVLIRFDGGKVTGELRTTDTGEHRGK
jgi:Icc-related predicted phosphoesterase